MNAVDDTGTVFNVRLQRGKRQQRRVRSAVRQLHHGLGEVLVARKTYVNVKDKNSSTAALENGDLSSDQKIVTSSDREISSGSRIRLLEE